MLRHPDPYASAALEAERATFFRVLLVNVVADAGYVGLGIALTRHQRRRAAGAGAAVAIQGAFLLLHDAHYAWRTRLSAGLPDQRGRHAWRCSWLPGPGGERGRQAQRTRERRRA